MRTLLVLGCGYTGRRVAQKWLARGGRVIVTTRHPESVRYLQEQGATVLPMEATDPASIASLTHQIPDRSAVLHSIPVVGGVQAEDPTPRLLDALRGKPSRLVYLSTTGVYGNNEAVDHTTLVAPGTPRLQLRVDAERSVANCGYSWLVLRPAAIYGPWRGVHASMRKGRFALSGDGTNYTSRIHVDDLAAHALAGLESSISGCFPVADGEPCPSVEVARFCSNLLSLPMPESVPLDQLSETRRSNRKVNGEAIRRQLRLELSFPSYREGIVASIQEEERSGHDRLGHGRFLPGQHLQHQ